VSRLLSSGTTLALIGLLLRFCDIVDFAPHAAIMVGLGMGIDYGSSS
jgi:hypothetical protein